MSIKRVFIIIFLIAVNPHLWGAHIRRMYKCAIVVFSKTKIAATR